MPITRIRPPKFFGRRTEQPARRFERHDVTLDTSVRLLAGEPVAARISDLSRGGCQAWMAFPPAIGTMLRIALPGGRWPHARVARWLEGGNIGCEFAAPLDEEEFGALLSG